MPLRIFSGIFVCGALSPPRRFIHFRVYQMCFIYYCIFTIFTPNYRL